MDDPQLHDRRENHCHQCSDAVHEVVSWPCPSVAEMIHPARCTYCQKVYDLGGKVQVTRPFDAEMTWQAPCCGREVSARRYPEDFKDLGRQHY
jgi:hypothetical protein